MNYLCVNLTHGFFKSLSGKSIFYFSSVLEGLTPVCALIWFSPHFERTIVCVLSVWNWMVSSFGEQRRGNDLYSPAVSEWSWGGARERERERGARESGSEGNYIVLPLCDNGLLWHSHTLWCGVSISQYSPTRGMNGKFESDAIKEGQWHNR